MHIKHFLYNAFIIENGKTKITIDPGQNLWMFKLRSLLPRSEWEGLGPDVLVIPIGGLGQNTWTMDVQEAIKTVKCISPKKVIPCHYNVSFLWKRNAAPADDELFRREIENMGIECAIMKYGDEIIV